MFAWVGIHFLKNATNLGRPSNEGSEVNIMSITNVASLFFY
jgi:hypothetical protein